MQIVIDIDENVFTRLFDNGTEDYAIVNDDLFAIAKSIRKGTPLPKGHGRLIDVDALDDTLNMLEKVTNEDSIVDKAIHEELMVCIGIVNEAPTIIEADKAESEG